MLTFKSHLDAEKEFNEENYLILTDKEADKAVKEYIKDSVWAFSSAFLSRLTGLNIDVFEAIQSNNKCEDDNEVILKLVNKFSSLNKLTKEAISADGRGHFLSSYDGHETEIMIRGKMFFVYKIN
jgi:hypothetical protein